MNLKVHLSILQRLLCARDNLGLWEHSPKDTCCYNWQGQAGRMGQELVHNSKNWCSWEHEKQWKKPTPEWRLWPNPGLRWGWPSHRKLLLHRFPVTGDIQVPMITAPSDTSFHTGAKNTEQRDDQAEEWARHPHDALSSHWAQDPSPLVSSQPSDPTCNRLSTVNAWILEGSQRFHLFAVSILQISSFIT